MTTYRRRGHYRRGPHGGRVWVSSHMVTRSGGWRYVPSTPRYQPSSPLPVAAKAQLPRSARWAKPNAQCPVCGAAVYFYSNEFGSRVFFDEIGPPWPKHPCTDNVAGPGAAWAESSPRVTPVIYKVAGGRRKTAEARRADRWEDRVTANATPSSSCDAFIVQGAWQNEQGTLLHLQRLYEKSSLEGWGTPMDVSLEPGQLVFMDEGRLSYLDEGRLRVVRFPVYFQYRIPKESFLQRLRARFNR